MCFLILVPQVAVLLAQTPEPPSKHYDRAIISTLTIGLTLQTAGIALLTYSSNYLLSEISQLESERGLPGVTSNINETLKENRNMYNNYFISSITLFSVGTVGTIVGLGLVISKAVNSWNHTKENDVIDTAYKQLYKMSSIPFSKNVTLSMYSLTPAIVMFSIK